jgi:Immunity protein 26
MVEMSKNPKLPFQEGDWFLVPLETDFYALGLIARIKPKLGSILGFFFDLAPSYVNDKQLHLHLSKLESENAIVIMKFGFGALMDGYWPVIHRSMPWYREKWAVKDFSYGSEILNKFEIRTYDADDPFSKVVRITKATPEELKRLPKDSLFDPTAVANELKKTLKPSYLTEEIIPPLIAIVNKNRSMDSTKNDGVEDSEIQAVLINLKLSNENFGGLNEVREILDLGDDFHQLFESREDIKFDGDEIGEGYATMFFYGRDADNMFAEILPKLQRFKLPSGSYAIKRYGDIGAREDRIELTQSRPKN